MTCWLFFEKRKPGNEKTRPPVGGGFSPLTKAIPKTYQKKLGNFFVYQQLQASHHTSFRMGASVACIAQHKDIPRHGIKDKLQGSTGVSTADDSSVGRLTFLSAGEGNGHD